MSKPTIYILLFMIFDTYLILLYLFMQTMLYDNLLTLKFSVNDEPLSFQLNAENTEHRGTAYTTKNLADLLI